jgi:Zn-dependent M32 family carboxypeptidase
MLSWSDYYVVMYRNTSGLQSANVVSYLPAINESQSQVNANMQSINEAAAASYRGHVFNNMRHHSTALASGAEMLNAHHANECGISESITTRNQPSSSTEGNTNQCEDALMYKPKGMKYRQLQQMLQQINEKLIEAGGISNNWMRAKATGFYSALQSWLNRVIEDDSRMRMFEAKGMQSDVNDFDSLMESFFTAVKSKDSSEVEGIQRMIRCFVQESIEQCSSTVI